MTRIEERYCTECDETTLQRRVTVGLGKQERRYGECLECHNSIQWH
jgi:hypothetical protein